MNIQTTRTKRPGTGIGYRRRSQKFKQKTDHKIAKKFILNLVYRGFMECQGQVVSFRLREIPVPAGSAKRHDSRGEPGA
jgi:hypothetical protein